MARFPRRTKRGERPGGGAKGWIGLLAAVGAGYLLVSLTEQTAGPGSGPSPSPAVGGPGPARGAYALTVANTWPPLEAGQAASPAADLAAASYYVVLDASGSMKESGCSDGRPKIDVAREALATFAQSVGPASNLGLAVFEERGLSERLPLSPDNRDRFVAAVQGVAAGGGTPLSDALALAYDRLLAQGRRQLGYGEYHLVVVTDGQASQGYDPTAVVNQILAESPVVVHTVGFCIGEDHSLNQPGRTRYRAAADPEGLRRGLEEVLAEAPSFDVGAFSP